MPFRTGRLKATRNLYGHCRNNKDFDPAFRWLTIACGLLILVLVCGIFWELYSRLGAVAGQIRLRLPLLLVLEPGEGRLRRRQQHLRHPGLDRHLHGHCRPLEPGHRPLPGGAGAAAGQPRGRRGDRAAGRHPQHHLRHVGALRLRPLHGRLRAACAGQNRRPLLQGPADGDRHAYRRHHPGADDSSLHHLGHPRRLPDGPAGGQGIGLRHGFARPGR